MNEGMGKKSFQVKRKFLLIFDFLLDIFFKLIIFMPA